VTADLAIFPPPAAAWRSPAAGARHLYPAALPRWRALLGLRWQERLERVTEFSVAYHDAREAAADAGSGRDARQAARRRASALLHRAVAERLALAEIEAALARLAAGRFGWCEQCGTAITTARLAEIPQARYCPECERQPPAAEATA
jgi:RNA polymerase-binding transcription factor DksA